MLILGSVEVRLMKMPEFPKLFHSHWVIHPPLPSNSINEIKSAFAKFVQSGLGLDMRFGFGQASTASS